MDTPSATEITAPVKNQILRGVNLGNWLVLEKWMSPRIFEGTSAIDEYTLCEALGQGNEAYMLRHRDEYIGEADFQWLHERGINAVRIPFGYWLFSPDKPFVSSPWHLDNAIALAEKYDIKVVLDLHGLPGFQGPNDHTGRVGHFQWHKEQRHLDRSLDVIEEIAQRYASQRSVVAFSVVNEPEPSVGREFLVSFYERVRKHMKAEDVTFVLAAFPEGEMPTYHGCLGERANVWTDVHLYECFGEGWEKMPLLDYLAYPIERQGRLRAHLQRGPAIVGEWSMGMAGCMAKQIAAMPPYRQQLIMRMHGQMQLAMMEEFQGWFFWSYKVDNWPVWSFRDSVARGWLPDQYGD